MESLSSLPNIGKTLEEKLEKVGINSPEELKELGSENALLRIREIDQSGCYNMLCALEGAIQGIQVAWIIKRKKRRIEGVFKLKEYSNHIQ